MVTTNISRAKHLDGRRLAEADIMVGLQIYVPNQTGGVLKCKCTSLTADSAEFESLREDWPLSFAMKFNQPGFDLETFESLYEAMIDFDRQNHRVSPEQRQLIHHAHELGYVTQRSYTQAAWTEEGYDAYKEVKTNTPDQVVNGYKVRYNSLWNKWQISHPDIGGCEEFATQKEAIEDALKG